MSSKEQPHVAACLTLTGFLVGLFLLSSCVSLDEKACRSVDWRSIGIEDAVSGRKTAHPMDPRAACAAYAGGPGAEAYREGYAEGLEKYCRPGTVFQLGRNGEDYPTQCSDGSADQLKISYGYGRDIYELDSDISRMRTTLIDKRGELKQAEALLATSKAEFKAQAAASAHRFELLEQIQQQSMRIDLIQAALEQLNYRLTTRQTQLARLVSVLQ